MALADSSHQTCSTAGPDPTTVAAWMLSETLKYAVNSQFLYRPKEVKRPVIESPGGVFFTSYVWCSTKKVGGICLADKALKREVVVLQNFMSHRISRRWLTKHDSGFVVELKTTGKVQSFYHSGLASAFYQNNCCPSKVSGFLHSRCPSWARDHVTQSSAFLRSRL